MSINPNAKSLPRASVNIDSLVRGIQIGDRSMLSQAITIVESRKVADKALAKKLLQSLPKNKNTSFRIGITGNPGVGKSTLIERLGNNYIKSGHRIAVLAFDPSSPNSGGSILGDRTRMEKLSKENNAFIRPSSSSGQLGGTGNSTKEIIYLCESAGYDRIIIETVGVGQNEITVNNFVDCFVLMALPGAGDEIQGIKRGILESADILAVNKADGEQINLAEIALGFLKNALHLFSHEDGWLVPAISISAKEDKGVNNLLELIEKCCRHRMHHGYLDFRRKKQNEIAFDTNWRTQIADELIQDKHFYELNKSLKEKIIKGDITPEKALDIFIQEFREIIKTPR
ncbi:methylmalonyl Co-A mutase-associated GTPase MeaB [Schleiferiaceae bacterium]|jgi:LAO/AO transport system kinase|nr:methylmalonyl Co-A mutase-associated GTPase MeaB [Schleiferiaceae bacterium]